MNKQVDIIGAGIIGLLTAYELSQKGYHIRIFERDWQGGEASWAGGGICASLSPWSISQAQKTLIDASYGYYPKLADILKDTTGIDIECVQSGMIIHRQEQMLWLPKIYQVRNSRLMAALKKWTEIQTNIEIIQSTVENIIAVNHSLDKIETNDRKFSSDKLIVTAGAWTAQLLKPFGNFSIYPVKGQMLAVLAPIDFLKTIIVTDSIYLVPRKDGLILIGSTLEYSGFDKTITEAAKEFLLTSAYELIPSLRKFKITHHWAGLRPGGEKIQIGPIPKCEGLFAASGHFRCGLTMAPATAQLLTELVINKKTTKLSHKDYSWRDKINEIIEDSNCPV